MDRRIWLRLCWPVNPVNPVIKCLPAVPSAPICAICGKNPKLPRHGKPRSNSRFHHRAHRGPQSTPPPISVALCALCGESDRTGMVEYSNAGIQSGTPISRIRSESSKSSESCQNGCPGGSVFFSRLLRCVDGLPYGMRNGPSSVGRIVTMSRS
jgi:hypothetical protein